jgi:hypothetical protein
VATELGVTLRGPTGRMSARRVLEDLQQILNLVGELEDAQLGRYAQPRDRSTWSFSRLGVGSVEAVLAPAEPRGRATWADLKHVVFRVVEGYDEAERREVLPDGWTAEAAKPASALARGLGTTTGTGMRLRLLVDGNPVREVEVTRRAGLHLDAAVDVRRESVGSIVGTVGSITVKGRNIAGLWPDRGGPRVPLWFTDEQTSMMRDAFASRVQVSGLVRRNIAGQAVGVTVRRLERLPSHGAGKPLTGLVGLAPSLTGDRSTQAFLDEIRGTS